MRVASAPKFRSDSPSPRAVEYCREARRLRCRLAEQPDRMYGALKTLSRRHDRLFIAAKRNPDRVRVAATVVQPNQLSSGTQFADAVEAAMDGSILRYSMRMNLLKAAVRAGIGRFEANLIIAAVQHRRAEGGVESPEDATPQKSSKWRGVIPLATLGAIQAMIVAAAMWALHA